MDSSHVTRCMFSSYSHVWHPTLQLRSRPYAGEIWKRTLHSETHQMFTFHTTPTNATITGHSDSCLRKLGKKKITWFSWYHRFRKAPFPKFPPSSRKRKADVSKFLRFWKLWFRDGLVWTAALTIEIKWRFQIPPGEWTLPEGSQRNRMVDDKGRMVNIHFDLLWQS